MHLIKNNQVLGKFAQSFQEEDFTIHFFDKNNLHGDVDTGGWEYID